MVAAGDPMKAQGENEDGGSLKEDAEDVLEGSWRSTNSSRSDGESRSLSPGPGGRSKLTAKKSAGRRMTSKMKNLAMSIASAPVNLAQAIAPSNSFRKSKKDAAVAAASAAATAEELESSGDEDIEDDMLSDGELEDESIDAVLATAPARRRKDGRLSAVMELSVEWKDDDDLLARGGTDDEQDEDGEITPSSGKSGNTGSDRSKRTSLASKVGKAAISMAKAPLNLTKRLGTVGEEDEINEKDPVSSSSPSMAATLLNAPSKMVKDAAVGISKVPKNIVKVQKNIASGIKEFGQSSMSSMFSTPSSRDAVNPIYSPVRKNTHFVIRDSRPPLTIDNSLNGSSLRSFLASNPSVRSRGLLIDSSGHSSFSLSSSEPSTRTRSLHGSGQSSRSSMDSMPSLMSMRSMMDSMGSMPSLASIGMQDSVMNLNRMPSLASIGAQDSVMNLNSSYATYNSQETNDSRSTVGGSFHLRDLQIISDNFGGARPTDTFAGTQLDELSPAFNIRFHMKYPDSHAQRWGTGEQTFSPTSPFAPSVHSYSSRYTTGVNIADGSASGVGTAASSNGQGDAAPMLVRRQMSIEFSSFSSSASLSPMVSPSGSNRSLTGRKTLPVWSAGPSDSAPNAAQRRVSDRLSLMSLPFAGNFESNSDLRLSEPDMTISGGLPAVTTTNARTDSLGAGFSAPTDAAPRAARRRSSSQHNKVPLPTLLEVDDHQNGEKPSMIDAATLVAASYEEDSPKDSTPRVATRRSSYQDNTVPPLPPVAED